VEALREEGHALRTMGRTPVPGVATHYSWSAGEGEPPEEALSGADAVVHLAGEPVAQRWNEEVKRRIRDSRVQGTRDLVRALSTLSRRPAILVSASAIGFYGDRGNEILTETSAPGSDFLAATCREWEAEAILAESLGLRVVLLRIGIVLGPGGGALAKMAPPFKVGAGGPLAGGRQWMSWIDRDDLVGLVRFALKSQSLRGVVNATAPQPVRNAEFTHALAHALQRPAIVPVPSFALRLLYGEMAYTMLASQRVLPEVARIAGYRFVRPFLADSLAAALE
jgi:uncharacterized protein